MSVYKNVEGVKSDILTHNPIFLPKKDKPEPVVKKPPSFGGGAMRMGLNSKAAGTRSQGPTKSLPRNGTQRGQLSAAATGDTSQMTSGTVQTSSFANKLSQKVAKGAENIDG